MSIQLQSGFEFVVRSEHNSPLVLLNKRVCTCPMAFINEFGRKELGFLSMRTSIFLYTTASVWRRVKLGSLRACLRSTPFFFLFMEVNKVS